MSRTPVNQAQNVHQKQRRMTVGWLALPALLKSQSNPSESPKIQEKPENPYNSFINQVVASFRKKSEIFKTSTDLLNNESTASFGPWKEESKLLRKLSLKPDNLVQATNWDTDANTSQSIFKSLPASPTFGKKNSLLSFLGVCPSNYDTSGSDEESMYEIRAWRIDGRAPRPSKNLLKQLGSLSPKGNRLSKKISKKRSRLSSLSPLFPGVPKLPKIISENSRPSDAHGAGIAKIMKTKTRIIIK